MNLLISDETLCSYVLYLTPWFDTVVHKIEYHVYDNEYHCKMGGWNNEW